MSRAKVKTGASRAQQVCKLMERAERSKKVIAAERDTLRNIYSDLENLLETVDEGLGDITCGLRSLSDGIDRLSEQL